MEKHDTPSSINNVNLLDLGNNYSSFTPSSTPVLGSFSTPIINNVAIDQNTLLLMIM